MTYFDALFLGILQGLTEFLPVSSSGHLVLFESILGLEFNESTLKGFDVVLHFGTLLAIIIYFKNDLINLFKGVEKSLKTKKLDKESTLFRNLLIATIPALFVGFFFNDLLDELFRNVKSVGIMLGLTGLVLILSEKFPQKKQSREINLKESILIGIAQSIALIPGISRSGSTISTAMFQGISRDEAARFAFLMAIPAISAATGYILLKALLGKIVFPEIGLLLTGFIASLISSYLCVKFLMHFIRKHSLSIFSYYLFIASLVLIFWQ